MRFALLLVTMLFAAGPASAAPVPTDPKAETRRLEALWADLLSPDAVVHARAVFALLDHPRATDFLAGKLPPVKASADQLKAWLTDLNSDDEKVRQAAFEELQYFDPRLELTPPEQVNLVTTPNGQRLLASVWWGWSLKQLRPDTVRTELKPQPGTRAYMFTEHYAGGSSGTGSDVLPVAEVATPAWRRVAVAALILGSKGTDESRGPLKRLATGHPDALPTRTAAELLKAKASAGMTEKQFAPVWGDLLLNVLYSSDPVAITRGLLTLVKTPESATLLKAKLPAIKASKEQVTKWMKALDSEDDKMWKPAFESLRYNLPMLTHTWQEQCDAVTTDRGRSALYLLWCNNPVPEQIEVYPGAQLSPREDGLTLNCTNPGGAMWSTWVAPGRIDTASSPHWQRVRLAIMALERMKTADAKGVLKQLADGHPDILPTKEAKAVLKRLEK